MLLFCKLCFHCTCTVSHCVPGSEVDKPVHTCNVPFPFLSVHVHAVYFDMHLAL